MEFHCRLGTAGGQIVEAVYAAESEAHLRRDLEDKGLLVLSLRPSGLLGALGPTFGRRRRIRQRDFLEFNQELATLLKAGMPLVQSLDLLRGSLVDPVFKPVIDTVYERVKAGAQMSDAFDEFGALVPRVYVASLMAGERSGNLEVGPAPLCRVCEAGGQHPPQDDLRADVPADSGAAGRRRGGHHRLPPGAGVLGVLRELRFRTADADAGDSVDLEFRAQLLAGPAGRRRGLWLGRDEMVWPRRAAGPHRPCDAVVAVGRRHRPQVRHLADGAHAGDAAQRRDSRWCRRWTSRRGR